MSEKFAARPPNGSKCHVFDGGLTCACGDVHDLAVAGAEEFDVEEVDVEDLAKACARATEEVDLDE